MQLLSAKAEAAIDRLIELAGGDHSLVNKALATQSDAKSLVSFIDSERRKREKQAQAAASISSTSTAR